VEKVRSSPPKQTQKKRERKKKVAETAQRGLMGKLEFVEKKKKTAASSRIPTQRQGNKKKKGRFLILNPNSRREGSSTGGVK